MGAGDDTFVWNPGDDNDIVEGQAGFDTHAVQRRQHHRERSTSPPTAARVRFTRDVANVTMDLNDVEGIDFNALGGADNITVNDLTGTDVTQVNLDLARRPAARPATARPTPSSSTAPPATTSSICRWSATRSPSTAWRPR